MQLRIRTTLAALVAAPALLLTGCGDDGLPGLRSAPQPADSELTPVSAYTIEAPERVVIGGERFAAPSRVGVEMPEIGRAEVPDFEQPSGFEEPGSPDGEPATIPGAEREPYFADGELCTHIEAAWARECAEASDTAACMRDQKFAAWFPDGLSVGVEPHAMRFHTAVAVERALPGEAAAAPIGAPSSDGRVNRLVAGIIALRMNMAATRDGLGHVPFETVFVDGGPFDGRTIAGVAHLADRIAAGEIPADFDAVADELAALNASAAGCEAADFVRRTR